MHWRRKITKLLSRDAYDSLVEHIRRRTHPVDAQKLAEPIDREQWGRLRETYPSRPGARGINRFEDLDYWLKINVERAQDLWLDRSTPLRVLDLGCGAGYFVYVCNQLGHTAIGLDIDDTPLFRGTTELLGVTRVLHRIEPRVLLPQHHGRFDLITAHRICFHRLDRDAATGAWREWSLDDWRFFIDDIRANQLTDGGRLMLDFLPRSDGRSFFTPEHRRFFESQGGRIFRSKVLLGKTAEVIPTFRAT